MFHHVTNFQLTMLWGSRGVGGNRMLTEPQNNPCDTPPHTTHTQAYWHLSVQFSKQGKRSDSFDFHMSGCWEFGGKKTDNALNKNWLTINGGLIVHIPKKGKAKSNEIVACFLDPFLLHYRHPPAPNGFIGQPPGGGRKCPRDKQFLILIGRLAHQ